MSLNGLNRHSPAPCSISRWRTKISASAVMKTIGIVSRRRISSFEDQVRSFQAWPRQGAGIWSGQRNQTRGTPRLTRTRGQQNRTAPVGQVEIRGWMRRRRLRLQVCGRWRSSLSTTPRVTMLQFGGGRPLSFSIGWPRCEDLRSLHGAPGLVTAFP